MKICHLTSVHDHNDTRIFIKECRSLVQAGYQVHYVVPDISDFEVDGVQLHGVMKVNDNRFKRMTKTVNQVYRKGLEIDADVYHFHDPELIPIGLKLKRLGKKVIYDIHEDVPRAILSKHWISAAIRKPVAYAFEVFENTSSKKFDFLSTATPFITKRFKKANLNTVNINNYPLINELLDAHTEGTVKKANSVCYIGVIAEMRGVNQLLHAANLVNGAIEFAGPISSENKEKLDKQENVHYLGILNRNELKNLLSKSAAGLVTFLPEPNHINAQPNKMFEYMSAGIPVICSDFPLWREIIEKNECGICVNPEDPQAIAAVINYLLENPEIAERMGNNGRKAIETEYNWEAESSKLIAIYKSFANECN
ncbi:glycosyltransferase family 4 protein [Neobacillus sp. NPDC058068]|uniref:glycosyltransferase family 4 protein n=1 Tax=Neobacillus sp. NPDC058068 TaxID=3346325 RepID=UPI0036D8A34F